MPHDYRVLTCNFPRTFPIYVLTLNVPYPFIAAEAVYVSCNNARDSDCTEAMTITAGETVHLDMSIMFVDGGPTNQLQTVNGFQLFNSTNAKSPIYRCEIIEDGCTNMGDVDIVQDNNDKYNITLGVRMNVAGRYTYKVEYLLINPRTSRDMFLIKTFTVTVNSKYVL